MKGKNEIIEEVLELIKLKLICRIRGLQVDINNREDNQYFIGAREEFETFLLHLRDEKGLTLKWIIADIDCATKYLLKAEMERFKEIRPK